MRSNRPGASLSVFLLFPAPILAASIGQRDSATNEETATENAITKPNSENRLPTMPGMNETGTNTAASVAVVESTANTISRVPITAAARGPAPMARWRAMFSITMMASSTTRPVATTSASSVMMLSEKPAIQMAARVPMSEIGIAIVGAIVAWMDARNIRITRTTITPAITRAMTTSRTASSIKTASSEMIDISTPGGRLRFSS